MLKNRNTSYKGKAFSVIKTPNEIPCLSERRIFNKEKNAPKIRVVDVLNLVFDKSLKYGNKTYGKVILMIIIINRTMLSIFLLGKIEKSEISFIVKKKKTNIPKVNKKNSGVKRMICV